MENYLGLLLALFAAFAITNFIQAQEQQGIRYLLCYIYLPTTKVFFLILILTALVFMVNLYHVCKQGSSVWIVGYLRMDGPLIMIRLAGCTSPRTQHSSRVEKLVKFSQLW